MPAELILRNYIITARQPAARPNRGGKRRSNGGAWDFEDASRAELLLRNYPLTPRNFVRKADNCEETGGARVNLKVR